MSELTEDLSVDIEITPANEPVKHTDKAWEERRFRLTTISPRFLIDLFNAKDYTFTLDFLDPVPIPADVKIANVFHDPYRGCFAVLLMHESFAPVPEGESPPDCGHSRIMVTKQPKKETA